ncbi:ArsR/SmtB family transcription factor [Streptomyces himalayensis]|uniref:Helix-turn-helix transcriptional regulator n=1 Tax=Streptomyces himalayensis subsp. himalayensis TaxID=2756131 RepID=A0A7W0DQN2_9ACTN|nr:helix-turn-helix domain-containing protein [Streptomyces himalayensis]MBA2948988.1 helix-turn-helix transcriptional regulator [Streptomyces himalayensis subsp. himalayensis]
MAVEIRFTAASVAKVRFAISPLGETVLALRILMGTGGHAVHQPWVRQARSLLAVERELPLLRALIAGPLPSFLFPVPGERLPSMATELDLLRATEEAFFRREYGAALRVPAEEAPEPAAALPRLAKALLRCYELMIAPHWGRMRAVLEADIGRRALTLVDGGVQALFGTLHRDIAWDGGQLVVHGRRTPHSVYTVDTGGHGLVVLPSVFNWPNVGVDKSPVTAASIRYPAMGVGLLWESSPPTLAGLAPVLGHTRTALLAALAEPLTTAVLATRLGVTPSAVSQHLGALRGAGLVATQRNGRTALHLRTERATHLLGTTTP